MDEDNRPTPRLDALLGEQPMFEMPRTREIHRILTHEEDALVGHLRSHCHDSKACALCTRERVLMEQRDEVNQWRDLYEAEKEHARQVTLLFAARVRDVQRLEREVDEFRERLANSQINETRLTEMVNEAYDKAADYKARLDSIIGG